MKFMIAFLVAALPVAAVPQFNSQHKGAEDMSSAVENYSESQSQSGVGSGVPSVAIPKTTQVLVIETPKAGVTFQQIIAVMQAEVRATVQLYLDGKIREWYSRGDGKGVVFLVEANTVDEAQGVMETLPLAKEQLMDHQYIPLGPLMPLRMLAGPETQENRPRHK